MSLIYCHLHFHAKLLRTWRFPLMIHAYSGEAPNTSLWFD